MVAARELKATLDTSQKLQTLQTDTEDTRESDDTRILKIEQAVWTHLKEEETT